MNLSLLLESCIRQFSAHEGGADAGVMFSGTEFFFEGHFPGNPIVPAFVQIDIALCLASRALGRALELKEVTRAVFKRPVGPHHPLDYALSWQMADPGLTRLKCEVRSLGHSVAELAMRVS